jgi:hypothetical protein
MFKPYLPSEDGWAKLQECWASKANIAVISKTTCSAPTASR